VIGNEARPVEGSAWSLPTQRTSHQDSLPSTMADMEHRSQLEPSVGLDLPAILAQTLKPLTPLLQKVTYVRHGRRSHDPSDILVPAGYAAELVVTGLNTPVACCFDDARQCYVVEGGHKVGVAPRVLRVDVESGAQEVVLTWPDELWTKTGSVTGVAWRDGFLYLTNTDAVYRLRPGDELELIVEGLPGRGDHQVNQPLFGPDGKLYFAVGSATNSGVVGPDNAAYEWLPVFPDVHDVPGRDVVLAGRNFESHDVLGGQAEVVRTGAYITYRTPTVTGQVIAGSAKSNALLRCNPDGSELEVVAWGLRNPYGIGFDGAGRLFVTEHGMDDRNRHVIADYDDFYEIVEGAWYGFPDFASGIRLDDARWGEGGQRREPVLAEHPDPDPPKPFVTFPPHAAANGFAFSTDERFGFEGDAFVALFGDLAPVTTARLLKPVGYKVVRVDMRERRVVDFAVNRIEGPASKLPHGGFERPSDCEFGPDGALYVVDWGEIDVAPEAGGVRMQAGSGSLWRIRRVAGEPGVEPPASTQFPFYALQLGAWLLGAVAAAVAVVLGVRRLLNRRRGATP